MEFKIPKKLIEVALPLDDINEASVREKSIRHGHPSTLHLWWARRPLATARAVIFAQMVNDPGYQREIGYGVNKAEAEVKREKLFQIIRELVKWENTDNQEVWNQAREAIKQSWQETCNLNRNHPEASALFDPNNIPDFHDPFAGGGAIPLEAQRLGLNSYASDLNPVPVILNRAMIEIPPKFANSQPIGPIPSTEKQQNLVNEWRGARGLAEDVRRYGIWLRDRAEKEIGHIYPKVKITAELLLERPDLKPLKDQELTVIAWLWTRTIKSPNPVFGHVSVPLISNFILSSKKGKEVFIEPLIEGDKYQFAVRLGSPPPEASSGTSLGKKAGFKCLVSGAPMDFNYIRSQGASGLISNKMLAVVADSPLGRVYLSPTKEMEEQAHTCHPDWKPETPLVGKSRVNVGNYGLQDVGDLFTQRQLIALTQFADLIPLARDKVLEDSRGLGLLNDQIALSKGGTGVTAYADAIATYLALAVSRTANTLNAHALWSVSREQTVNMFSRQAIPMNWDFPEVNPFAGAAGDFGLSVSSMKKSIESCPAIKRGEVRQANAMTQNISENKVVSTDPPYYDNIAYADLSDFFYVWLRRSLKALDTELFSTVAAPKDDELVATPYRHKTKLEAETFFMEGMSKAISNLAKKTHPAFPVTIYYAFKQSETKQNDTLSAGWVTFLEAVTSSGFVIDGTWPMRTERPTGVKVAMNALASSIILVCKKRAEKAQLISRREFQKQLREKMPEALETMIGGESGRSPLAPVDLAQAAIGPGIAIYSEYEAILNQDGSRMGVSDALILINRVISEYLDPDEGSYDSDTQFCSKWFSQFGWAAGPFGEADTLARAKGTSVEGVQQSGVADSGAGKVRLFKWNQYPTPWDPRLDDRTPVWEACHQLIRSLNTEGETYAGSLLAKMPEQGEPIRQLAYHLYTICERKKWAEDARAYNELIGSWHAIVAASHEAGRKDEQIGLEL